MQICIKNQRASFVGLELDDFVSESNLAWIPQQRSNRRAAELAVLPLQINLEPAPRSQALDRAIRPRLRQRGKQRQFSGMTLQQHLGHGVGAAEVCVDLE